MRTSATAPASFGKMAFIFGLATGASLFMANTLGIFLVGSLWAALNLRSAHGSRSPSRWARGVAAGVLCWNAAYLAQLHYLAVGYCGTVTARLVTGALVIGLGTSSTAVLARVENAASVPTGTVPRVFSGLVAVCSSWFSYQAILAGKRTVTGYIAALGECPVPGFLRGLGHDHEEIGLLDLARASNAPTEWMVGACVAIIMTAWFFVGRTRRSTATTAPVDDGGAWRQAALVGAVGLPMVLWQVLRMAAR